VDELNDQPLWPKHILRRNPQQQQQQQQFLLAKVNVDFLAVSGYKCK